MSVFILALSYTVSNQTWTRVVNAPEEAAFTLWEWNRGAGAGFAAHYRGELYEVDLKTLTVIRREIPEIKFSEIKK